MYVYLYIYIYISGLFIYMYIYLVTNTADSSSMFFFLTCQVFCSQMKQLLESKPWSQQKPELNWMLKL